MANAAPTTATTMPEIIMADFSFSKHSFFSLSFFFCLASACSFNQSSKYIHNTRNEKVLIIQTSLIIPSNDIMTSLIYMHSFVNENKICRYLNFLGGSNLRRNGINFNMSICARIQLPSNICGWKRF